MTTLPSSPIDISTLATAVTTRPTCRGNSAPLRRSKRVVPGAVACWRDSASAA